MNIERVVNQIKDHGYKVKVSHERATHADVKNALVARGLGVDKLARPATAAKVQIAKDEISPFGGRTIALIVDQGTEIARGIAQCSPIDAFSNRVGASKALGRAVSQLLRVDPKAKINTGKKG